MFEEPELTKNIQTREDFVKFVRQLSEEYNNEPEDWEHNNLGSYLEALSEFADSIDGFYTNFKISYDEEPNWKMFANMLAAARNY